MPSSNQHAAARIALALVATSFAGVVAWWIWRCAQVGSTIELVESGSEEELWRGDGLYAVDPVAGLRPRRDTTTRMPMLAVDDSDLQQIVKRRDRNGFLRETDLPDDTTLPKVLVLGDSHVDGVVATADNFTSLLEAASHEAGRPYLVLNAGCGFYSLWQHVLRARDLLASQRPKVVVITVFLGNDFLELDNPTMPHLDDALHEQPASALERPEATSARQRELAIPPPYDQLFWQGLNQALYLHRDPQRAAAIVRKCEYAVAAMQTAAAQAGAEVVWALLPSFDLVFPDHTMGLGPVAQELTRAGAQRAMRDAFVAVLQRAGVRMVDFEPVFVADGQLALYAKDFHVYRRAHRRMAEALQPLLAELLR